MAGAGGSQEFWVKPDELKLVADSIADLLARVNGETGEYGSQRDFQEKASSSELIAGLGNLDGGGGGSGAFGSAYGQIYSVTNETYAKMVQNLTNLEAACRSTVEQYRSQEELNEQNIHQTDPGGV